MPNILAHTSENLSISSSAVAANTCRISKITLCAAFAIVIAYFFMVITYNSNGSAAITFWLSIAIGCVSSLSVLLSKTYPVQKYVILIMWSVLTYLPLMLRSPAFLTNADELSTYGVYSAISSSGRIPVEWVDDGRSAYPGFSVLISVASSMLNISNVQIGRLLVLLMSTLVILFVVLFSRRVFKNDRIAFLSGFLFSISPMFIQFDRMVDYQSLGVLLFISAIFLLLRNNFKWKLLLPLVIISLSLTVSQGLSSYMFLIVAFFLTGICLIYRQKILINLQPHLILLAAALSACLIWTLYNALSVLSQYGAASNSLLQGLISFPDYFSLFREKTFVHSSVGLPYEFLFQSAYFPAILILLISGWLLSRKDQELKNSVFFKLLLVLGFIFAASLYYVPTLNLSDAQRVWSFVFLGISCIVAYGINAIMFEKKSILKINGIVCKWLVCILLFVVCVGALSLGFTTTIRSSPSSNFLVSGSSAATADSFASGAWLTHYQGVQNDITGDMLTLMIYGNCFQQNVHLKDTCVWDLFYPQNTSAIDTYFTTYPWLKDVVVDTRMSKLLAYQRSYFSTDTLQITGYPLYGYQSPLPDGSLHKFAESSRLDMVYCNGNWEIFYNINWN